MNFLSTYEYICQFIKSKQNKIKHICKQKNSKNKFKTREENLLATSGVGSGENFGRWWLETTTERRFWAFSDEKKVDLVGTVDNQQCISISGGDLGSDCQGLLEREDGVMEVLVCCGGVERNGEKEREMNILILQKGEKQERAGL